MGYCLDLEYHSIWTHRRHVKDGMWSNDWPSLLSYEEWCEANNKEYPGEPCDCCGSYPQDYEDYASKHEEDRPRTTGSSGGLNFETENPLPGGALGAARKAVAEKLLSRIEEP